MQPDDKLLCSPEEKAQHEIANQAGVIDYLADFVAKGRNRITEGDVLTIHDLTGQRNLAILVLAIFVTSQRR